MNILITGGNFSNKGAELMLLTLIDSIKNNLPESRICVSPLLGYHERVAELGMELLNYPLYHYGKPRFSLSMNFPAIAKILLSLKGQKIEGTVELEDVDVVMDISGYAFGDKWGGKPLHDLSVFTAKMKGLGAKFIILPQALGPFSIGQMKGDVAKVYESVDLLIARDEKSFEYVREAVGTSTKAEKLVLYPDITLANSSYKGLKSAESDVDFCAVIPNVMMLSHASEEWKVKYVPILTGLVKKILAESTLDVFILIHAQGGGKDAEVGKDILNSIDAADQGRILYKIEEDPLKLKAIISKAKFVIGSRFHALASALSSNVPAISTSWLHKYEMLFKEYGCDDFNFKEPNDLIYDKVGVLLDAEKRDAARNKLVEGNEEIARKGEDMWKRVVKELA
jgi:polysaccharide pyruvyl transferase WcaK-like protein